MKDNKILLVTFLAGISILIIYSAIIHSFGNYSDRWTWWSTFLAIVIASIIGVRIYFLEKLLDERKKSEQMHKDLKLEILLLLEETKDEKITEIKFTDGKKLLNTWIIFLRPFVIEEYIKSGLLPDELTEKLFELAALINSYNIKINFFLTIINHQNYMLFNEVIEKEEKTINKIVKDIRFKCENLLQYKSFTGINKVKLNFISGVKKI